MLLIIGMSASTTASEGIFFKNNVESNIEKNGFIVLIVCVNDIVIFLSEIFVNKFLIV